jgi:hypothetical protein
MPVPKLSCAQVGYAASKLLAATPEAAIIEHSHARSTKELHRRNIITKTAWQAIEPISFRHTEAVSLKSRVFKKAGSGTGNRPLVPRAIPSRVIPIDPWTLSKQQHSSANDSKR